MMNFLLQSRWYFPWYSGDGQEKSTWNCLGLGVDTGCAGISSLARYSMV